MCGIIGLFAFGDLGNEEEKKRQETMRYLSTELLQLTQSRGKDATGISVLFKNCDYMGLKMGISAVEFVSRFGGEETDFQGFMKIWHKKIAPAKIFIGHCRKPSGAKSTIDNINNHPIKIGDVVGVHNGTLDNHEVILKNLNRKPDGDVDSEAIFQLLHHFTNNGADPFTLEMLDETCKRLEGSYACLAFSGNNPFQVVAFRDSRPIHLALIRPLKLVIASSDNDFVKTALYRYNLFANVHTFGMNFATIHKDDLNLSILEDDTAFLFDLTKEIDAKTPLSSLYDKRKIVRIDKMWKNKDTNTYPYSQNMYNRSQFDHTNTKKTTEVNAITAGNSNDVNASNNASNNVTDKTTETVSKCNTSTEKTLTKKANPNGALIWNKSSRTYERADVVLPIKAEDIDELPNIFINTETEEVTLISKEVIRTKKDNLNEATTNILAEKQKNIVKEKQIFLLNKSHTSLKSENEVAAEIEIIDTIRKRETALADETIFRLNSEVEPVEGAEHIESLRNERDYLKIVKDKQISDLVVIKKQVNMSTLDPVSIELAIEAANSAQRFSSNSEVCEALSIHDNKNLEILPVYSLTNRIIKFTTEKAFLDGWKSAVENSIENALIIDDKRKKAEQGIRVSKILIDILSKKNTLSDTHLLFELRRKQITVEVLKAFSVDDLRKNKLLKRAQTLLTNEGN